LFAFRDAQGRVEAAFTDRHGGVSAGPYASLNLAVNDDEPRAVAENLRRVVGAFADPVEAPVVALMRQVHGAEVAVVTPQTLAREDVPTADALVTREPGVVLMVRVADCVPLILADVDHRVVGAVHAGRPGLAAGVVPRAVAAMRDLGADRMVAWLGPHVCGHCYEVPEGLRAEVSALVPEARAETSWGTPALDIGAGVRAQLTADGVEVVDASRCTIEDTDLYSYRRQGAASGRLAGLVWVRP
jgi:purine-nucleoside/S-methyl-5'-thioadenosine phosphorylase / adenosine deaminase